jgi:hypothetical protein
METSQPAPSTATSLTVSNVAEDSSLTCGEKETKSLTGSGPRILEFHVPPNILLSKTTTFFDDARVIDEYGQTGVRICNLIEVQNCYLLLFCSNPVDSGVNYDYGRGRMQFTTS